MALTVYILITILASVTAKKYTLQCSEHKIKPDDGSWVQMKSGQIYIEDELESSTQVEVDTNLYDANGKDIGGSKLNICDKSSSGERDAFVQALWDIWQVEESECPIQPQGHSYATNVTVTFNSVFDNLSKDQKFDMSMVVYRGIKAAEWLTIWYKCTM